MTLSPKNLLTIASVSILMAGANVAIAQEAETKAPEEAVAAETVETIETTDAPKVEIFTREAVEDSVVEAESAPEAAAEDADAMKIDASSETVIPAEETVEEVSEDAEEIVEGTVQPEE